MDWRDEYWILMGGVHRMHRGHEYWILMGGVHRMHRGHEYWILTAPACWPEPAPYRVLQLPQVRSYEELSDELLRKQRRPLFLSRLLLGLEVGADYDAESGPRTRHHDSTTLAES